MSAQVDVLAVINWPVSTLRNNGYPNSAGELHRARAAVADLIAERDALRELIAADVEYDEARRWWDQGCYTGWEGVSYETRVATADRFEEALARRAAALARAQGVQS